MSSPTNSANSTDGITELIQKLVLDWQVNLKYQSLLIKNLVSIKREVKHLKNKTKKTTNLKIPIHSTEFANFIIQYQPILKDKVGNLILKTLEKDTSGNILIRYNKCLKMINTYIRVFNLKCPEDKKLIVLDETLQKIFRVEQTRTCTYKDIMDFINFNLQPTK